MSPGLSLIILGLSAVWSLLELMFAMGGVEVVGDGGVFFACLWLSLSADSGLAAGRFLSFEGVFDRLLISEEAIFEKLWMSESSA